MDKLITVLLFTLLLSCGSNSKQKMEATIFKCSDVNWDYYLSFPDNGKGSDQCFYSSRIQSGQMDSQFVEREPLECWKAIALSQLEGSKCCITKKNGPFYQQGMNYCAR